MAQTLRVALSEKDPVKVNAALNQAAQKLDSIFSVANVNTTSFGINTGTNAIPGIFSVGWSQSPVTQGNVLFTIQGGAGAGHWINSVLGTSSPNQYKPSISGAHAQFISEVDITNLGSNVSLAAWFHHTVSAGTGQGGTGALFQTTASGTFTPSGTLPGVLALQTLAESSRGGYIFGGNTYARATSTAGTELIGLEVDTDNQINGTSHKHGIQVVDVSTSTGTVAADSAAYASMAQTGALGYKTFLQLGNSDGTLFPLVSTGTLLKAYSSSTIATGIDISSLTITGNAIATPGFSVSGSGFGRFVSSSAPAAGGNPNAPAFLIGSTSMGVFYGSGVPTIAATQGSLYLRSDGSSTSTRLYVNTNGSTGWTNVTTAA